MARAEADILEEILKTLKRGGGGAGGAPPRRGRADPGSGAGARPSPTEADPAEAIQQEIEAIQRSIEKYRERAAILGELSPFEQAHLENMQEQVRTGQEAVDGYLRTGILEREKIKNYEDMKAAEDDLIESQEELNRQMAAGAEKAELLGENMFKFGGAAAQAARILPTTSAELGTFTKSFFSMKNAARMGNLAITKIAAESFNLAIATDTSTAAFRRATGAADSEAFAHYGRVISGARNQVAAFGGTHEQVGAAMATLYGEMANYSLLSEQTQENLAAQTVAMQALGVSAGTGAQIMDRATKSLGFHESELVGLTQHLHDVAQSLGKTTTQVFEDFNSVSKKLAFYGTDVVDVFDKLSKQSKATGLSVDELVGISGTAFDTFDGAAQKVGRLNAILGGPYLNSIDMLNASEADRIEMMKESMDASGQMFSDMNKYEQLAIADALGVDVDTARRMFGELSAAEELQIKHQEEMAETAREAQSMIDKLKNAFMNLIVAMDPIIQILSAIVSGIAIAINFIGDLTFEIDGNEFAIGKWVITLTALLALWLKFRKAGKGFSALTKPFKSAGSAMSKFFGGGEEAAGGAAGASGGFISSIERLMEAIKGSAKELLAFGAAILMIGGGIGLAAVGLAQLVLAFKDLTGEQILGALAALIIVGILFSVMLYILSTASLSAVGPMLALGVAFLLIGAGIAIAAYGMSLLVGAFAELEGPQIWAAALALIFFSIAIAAIIIAAVGATAAAPVILALAVLLAAIGLAALLMGIGISIAARGMAVFVEAISKIPPKTLFQLALGIYALGGALVVLAVGLYLAATALVVMGVALLLTMPIIALSTFVLFGWAVSLIAVGIALVVVGYGLSQLVKNLLLIPPALILKTAFAFGVLGLSLITLAIGLVASAIGFALLGVSLLFTAPILLWAAIALGIFGASLFIVGAGLVLVAVGSVALAKSMRTMVTALPALREFAAALREIGGAAVGIALTAAALGSLTLSLAPFSIALMALNRKKLEALTEFNKSATLTVETVQKPAVPTENIKATEARMEGASPAAVGGGTVSKPVINFAQKSILVKIGDRELRDVIIEVLKDPAVGRAISGFGSG